MQHPFYEAFPLPSFWHLHQKTQDLAGSPTCPHLQQAPVCKMRNKKNTQHLAHLGPVTGAAIGRSLVLSPRLLVWYRSPVFFCFQENSLTLSRKGRRRRALSRVEILSVLPLVLICTIKIAQDINCFLQQFPRHRKDFTGDRNLFVRCGERVEFVGKERGGSTAPISIYAHFPWGVPLGAAVL